MFTILTDTLILLDNLIGMTNYRINEISQIMETTSKTMYSKGMVDNIIVSDTAENRKTLNGTAYQFNEDGECEIEMRFFDGLAVATDDSGLVMRYPKLGEVMQSDKMQQAIYQHTGLNCGSQFDVALTFGRLERYKMVADYDIWKLQGENEDIDITAIIRMKADGLRSEFLFDVLEEDYEEMLNADIVEGGCLCGSPKDDQVREWRAKYGILWTENYTKEMIGE